MMDHIRGMRRSATIWFNLIFGAFMSNFDTIRQSLPEIQPYLPASLFGKLMVVAFIVNIALRFKTNSSLADKVAPKDSTTP